MMGTSYGADYGNLRSRGYVDPTLKNLKCDAAPLVRAVCKMLLDSYNANVGIGRSSKIKEKDVETIRELADKFQKALGKTKISVGNDQIKRIIGSISSGAFDQAVSEALKERRSGGSGQKPKTYDEFQIASFLSSRPDYQDMRNDFVSWVDKAIVGIVQSEGLGDYKASEKVVDLLSRVMVGLHDKFSSGDEDFLGTLEKKIKEAKEQTKNLIDDLRFQLGQGTLKNEKKYLRSNMSMFEAFSKTVINNSKTYTKNVNLVRDMFLQNIRDKVQKIRRFTLKAKKTFQAGLRNLGRTLDATYKTARGFYFDFRRFFRGFGMFLGGNGRLGAILMAKNLISFLGRSFRLGTLGLYVGIRVLSKAASFAFSAFEAVGGFMFKYGFSAIKDIAKVGRGIFRGVVGAVSSPAKLLTKRLGQTYSFMVNNPFIKRFAKFLMTDAGAAFLGTMAAFMKVFVINPILDKLKLDDEIKDPEEPYNPNNTDFGKFLNRHTNIAYFIGGVFGIWMELKKMFDGKGIDGLLEWTVDMFDPYLKAFSGIWDILSGGARLALKFRFTTLSLKYLSNKGGLIGNLLGVGTGIAFDLIANSASGISKVKEGKIRIDEIDEAIINGSASQRSLMDREFGLRAIRFTERDPARRERMENDYLDLMNGIDQEQNEIHEANKILKHLRKVNFDITGEESLRGTMFDDLRNIVMTSNLLEKDEKMPGYDINVQKFKNLGKDEKIRYFEDVLDMRKARLTKIKNALRTYSERKEENKIGLLEYLDRTVGSNTFSSLRRDYRDYFKSFESTIIDPKKRKNFSSGGLITAVPDRNPFSELSWDVRRQKYRTNLIEKNMGTGQLNESIQLKLTQFRSIADMVASRLSSIGSPEQRKLMSQIFGQTISAMENTALHTPGKEGQNAIRAINAILEESMRENPEFKKIREILTKELEWRKSGGSDRERDILKDLEMSNISGYYVTIDVNEWYQRVGKIWESFREANGIDEGRFKVELDRGRYKVVQKNQYDYGKLESTGTLEEIRPLQ